MKTGLELFKRFGRTFAVVVLVVAGSTVLVRFAPGYLSDAREMDARYGGVARAELAVEADRSNSFGKCSEQSLADGRRATWASRANTRFLFLS